MSPTASAAPDAPRELTLVQSMLPGDANAQGNVHGGTLMKLADTAGGICCIRYARAPVVTVVMDSMTFEAPVQVGDLVSVRARITWTGRTSLETEVTVEAEDVLTGRHRRISQAYFVYVAIDAEGRPRPVRPFTPASEEERRLWADAEQRHARRLSQRHRAASPV